MTDHAPARRSKPFSTLLILFLLVAATAGIIGGYQMGATGRVPGLLYVGVLFAVLAVIEKVRLARHRS